MHLPPMVRDVTATAEPHPLEAAHIVKKFDQTCGTRRTADQTIMQANGHQPGMLCAFFVKQVESIPHIVKEVISMCEAVALIAAIVVGLVGVGDDQMRLPHNLDPVWEFVVERVAVIEETTYLYE